MSPKDRDITLSVLKRIFDNIIEHPHDDKYHQIKLTDRIFSSKVWQYPAGEELMKMSGWVVEGDHVRLRNGSRAQIASQLVKSLVCHSDTVVMPFPDDELQALIEAFNNGDLATIYRLLKVSHISPNGRIYSENGSSANLLEAATIVQQLSIVKLLMKDYSLDPYFVSMVDSELIPYMDYIFCCSPQPFIIAILKYCGVKADFKTVENYSLLHLAVIANCFDVVRFLIEECNEIDVNITDDKDNLQTPLHLAYLCGRTQIAEYLVQHGADVHVVDSDGCTPYDYTEGDPEWIENSEYLQNSRKIHHIPFSHEHCYFMKLVNLPIDVEEAVSLTMQRFPALKELGPTPPHHDTDYAPALRKLTQYIIRTTRSPDDPNDQQMIQPQLEKPNGQQTEHYTVQVVNGYIKIDYNLRRKHKIATL